MKPKRHNKMLIKKSAEKNPLLRKTGTGGTIG